MLKAPDSRLIAVLTEILGETNVISDFSEMRSYGSDHTEDLFFMPDIVITPETAEQVAEVLKVCNDFSVPVYTRGAGTGLSGGSLPVLPGVVLSTHKLNSILDIDISNFQVTVQPGVINDVLREEVEKHNLFYPPDPASKGSCFLGGNIAHGSGGPKAIKYGTTRDYVINLQLALPNGELIWTGANTVKNSTGFNLTQLIVGSEGLLGVVTAIVLRLLPRPSENILLLVPFAEAEQAATAVNDVLLTGVIPSSLELMEESGVKISASATDTFFPFYEDARYYLLIELDGMNSERLMEEAEIILPALEKNQALDVLMADSYEKKEQWWKVRRAIGSAVKAASVYKEEDTVVPRAALPFLLNSVKRIGEKYGFRTVCYGHAGDGNLHINILKDNLTDKQWKDEIPLGIREIFEVCRELKGTISGEHGIGLVQKEFLNIVFTPEHFRLMRGIKSVFDPKGIMNPGKWLD